MSDRFKKLDFVNSYEDFVKYNFDNYSPEKAVEISCGGNRKAYGYVERQILIKYGLKPSHFIVDVGCGYGRLAENLDDYLHPSEGRYLGIDVVPRLIEYAKLNCAKSKNISFAVGEGLALPCDDSTIDMITVFSVFTHMLHEDAYVYLEDMRRSLKVGGRLVISFLEFSQEDHWPVFFEQMKPRSGDTPSTLYQQSDTPKFNPGIMFTERAMWLTFAKHLKLKILEIQSGFEHHVPLDKPITLDNGSTWESAGTIGQSIIVFEK